MSQSPSPDVTSALSLGFVEELWKVYSNDPSAVEPAWRAYFEGLARTDSGRPVARSVPQHRVSELVRNYRVRGHRGAALNPLEANPKELPELRPDFYGFSEADMDLEFEAGELSPNGAPMTLRDIWTALRQTYCGSIGVQFMHIDGPPERAFLIERMERTRNRKVISAPQQRRILTRLTEAVTFERFVQTKFVGAKSFSLEGAESLIPLLDMAVEKAGEQGVEEVVLGMPHRGRLNVLVNIMGKAARQVFSEFKDTNAEQFLGRGDVKYHKGYHRDWLTAAGKSVHLDLCFNPSHLEFVGPVAQGLMRAKQDRAGDTDRRKGLLILMHGDAAFAGEGIVQEALNLSELSAYGVGGALHIVVNNQVGFTTTSEQSRSSVYCTDVAKLLQIPIFHVNGEHPEAVAAALDLALDFRSRFRRDVVIDMYCYRRRGHNEGDEPTFTQPLMYRAIKSQRSVRQAYLEHLLALGDITRDEALAISEASHARLEEEFGQIGTAPSQGDASPNERPSRLGEVWSHCRGGADKETPEVETGVNEAVLQTALESLCTVPPGFHVHPKLAKLLEARREMGRGRAVDWGTAEALALATLSLQGVRVRLSGQDSERGTFSHRHSVLHDMESDARYMPLRHLAPNAAPVEIYNSPLSEGAVLGFEYGYSLAWPDGLVMWEAQFGDFANAAQVYIDQFLASGEAKWNRCSGLVLLLPHGLEGTGPEHASARLERFLTLAASDNLQVMNLTTAAQYFHALRRQVLRPSRRPMVLMAPKSLLRAPEAASPLSELMSGRFHRLLLDDAVPQNAERVLLCSGKIYYDLQAERQRLAADRVAIVRLEQLYPLLPETLVAALQPHAPGTPVVFVQEETANMGALPYFQLKLAPHLRDRHPVHTVSRPESASPATGSHASHDLEQKLLLEQSFSSSVGFRESGRP